MNYVKKMCILRQVKQGFSGDGKTLSGLIKVEQYGKNLAVEVSVINFAPLLSGEYYCMLSDGRGKTEMLALRGKSLFNILSDIDISRGFCGVICYVKNDVIPIAYGVNGNGSYDWKRILNAALPPIFPQNTKEEIAETKTNEPTMYEMNEKNYNDEHLAEENYYEEKKDNGQIVFQKAGGNAQPSQGAEIKGEEARTDAAENADADGVRQPFEENPDGYYLSVKREIEGLFAKYPKDDTLNGAFSCSEWVRVKGEESNPEYLVGVIYEDGKALYICYALAAQERKNPPDDIKNVCTYVPKSSLGEDKGFFVIFQSAATGECIKPAQL